MAAFEVRFDDLAQATVERLLWDVQALIDRHGPDEGQGIAERTLASKANMALNDAPQMQPLNDQERKAVAYAVNLVLATVKADGKNLN
ncbi:hypothetical protein AAII07_48240 [Microvirga sp. 0TCS3.31]